MAVPTLDSADRSTEEHGTGRIARILSRFVEDLITAQYFREFLRREPARALRLLTTKDSQIHRRYVAVATALVRDELGDRPFDALDAPELGYLLVRVSESFTYADLITGEKPDPPRAAAAFDFVLRRT